MLYYCALLFQIITFWDGGTIKLALKENTVKEVLNESIKLTYVSAEYGHEVKTWGATMKQCEEMPAKDQLELLGFLIEFDGDGKMCNE